MIRLRQGTLNDAAAMARIFNHYVATSTVIFSNRQLSAEDMEEKLRPVIKASYPFVVAEIDGQVAGYCYCHAWQPDPVYSRTWEITIYLDHQSTGKGVGSSLLTEIIDLARKHGAHSLISCITAGNAPCEKMHINAGFRLNGLFPQVGYKFDTYLDDAIYQLML